MATKIMCFHEGSVPDGWEHYSSGDGKFIRGSVTPGGSGGSTTHSHNVTFPVGTSGGADMTETAEVITDLGLTGHNHSIPEAADLSSSLGSNLPLYKDVRMIVFEEVFDEV